MGETKNKRFPKKTSIDKYRKRLRKIQKLNLTSDLFSSVVFEDTLAVQDVLRILTGIRELKVIRVEPQRSYRNLYGHSSVLDIWAEDAGGIQYNIEIQMSEKEDHLRRSRFIQSRIDGRSLSEGAEYEALPELYLIFITKRDFLQTGCGTVEAVHTIKGMNQEVYNGLHEIYANFECPAEDGMKTELLRYIRDTNNPDICTEGFEHLVKRVKILKDEEGDVRHMCELLEQEWADGLRVGEARGEARGQAKGELLRLISLTMKKQAKGMTAEEIADMLEEELPVIDEILLAAVQADTSEPERVYECMETV